MMFSVITSSLVPGEGYAAIRHGNSYMQAVTWEAGKWFSPYARVGNIGDEEYEEVLGFPALARTWAIGLEARWP